MQTLAGGTHSADKKSQLCFSCHDITRAFNALPPALLARLLQNHFNLYASSIDACRAGPLSNPTAFVVALCSY